jgi:hypothetical protein
MGLDDSSFIIQESLTYKMKCILFLRKLLKCTESMEESSDDIL